MACNSASHVIGGQTNESSDPRAVGVVTAVMHDTVDVGEAVAFWTALLGLEVVHRDERYAYMGPMTEGGPYLAFQQVPEAKTSKNRLHLDVRVPNRAEFVERIEALGGTTIGEHQEGDYPSWIVMTDPQGNEFCVYESSTD